MRTGTLFLVASTTHIFADAAKHAVGSSIAGLAVWIAAGWLFGALLSAWWVPRA